MAVSTLYAGVNLISKLGGTISLDVLDTANYNQKVLRSGVAYRLRDQPNPETPAAVFWGTVLQHLPLIGNAFIAKLPSSDGIDAPELWLLSPEYMRVYRGDAGRRMFEYTIPNGAGMITMSERDIIHIRSFGDQDTLMGRSLIEAQREGLGMQLAAMEYQNRSFASGGVPKGILSVESQLTPEQATLIRDQWNATHGGLENSGKTAVLDRGATYQPVAMNNNDAQVVEQMR
jgi:HK97 family phage portal protein